MNEQISKGQFDEFRERVLDELKKQSELAESTNKQVTSHTTDIEVLKTQMGAILEHVKAEQQRARESKAATITSTFALVGTLIMAVVTWFKG